MKIFSTALKLIVAFSIAVQLFWVASPPQMAYAQPIGPAVLSADEIPCTRDLNPCGNPSMCLCPGGYSYNASVGACLIEDLGLADGPGEPVNSRCAFPPQSICTQDINAAGHSSICACPDGTEYSDVIGSCVIPFDY